MNLQNIFNSCSGNFAVECKTTWQSYENIHLAVSLTAATNGSSEYEILMKTDYIHSYKLCKKYCSVQTLFSNLKPQLLSPSVSDNVSPQYWRKLTWNPSGAAVSSSPSDAGKLPVHPAPVWPQKLQVPAQVGSVNFPHCSSFLCQGTDLLISPEWTKFPAVVSSSPIYLSSISHTMKCFQ